MSVLSEACHWDTLVSLGGDPRASVDGRGWQRYHVSLSFCQTCCEALAPAGTSVCWRSSEKCFYCYSVYIQSG